jgi:CDP-glycerol glycerophosphotransferase (TagB/SpsB family)
VVTGHPRFDRIFTEKHMLKHVFDKRLGLDPQKKLVFIATNMYRDIESLNILINLLTKNPLINVIIKAHPSEIKNLGVKNYEILSAMNKSVTLVTSMDLYDIIANIDIVVQEFSTVGLESMLFDKPVFCLRKKHDYETNDRYYYDPMSQYAHYDPEVLNKMIKGFIISKKMQINHNKKQKEFLSIAYPQRLSGQKLGDLIYKVTGVESYKPINNISDGMLIKGSGDKIYYIENALKRHITSSEIFKKMGFRWKDVIIINDTILEKIQDGPNINSPNSKSAP